MPATMLRTVCCRADGVSKPRSLGAEASRKLPGRIPKARKTPAGLSCLANFGVGSPCACGAGWYLACLTFQASPCGD